MRSRKLIAVLIIALVFTTIVFGDPPKPKLDVNKIQKGIETLVKNKIENFNAYFEITSELIRYTIAKYKDVKANDSYVEDLARLQQYGKTIKQDIITTTKDGKLNPTGNISRGEFAKALSLVMNYKPIDRTSFTDMTKHYARKEVEALLESKIILNSEVGCEFKPAEALKNSGMLKMLCRALKIAPIANPVEIGFLDDKEGYANAAHSKELFEGYIEKDTLVFKPSKKVTRAEAIVILSKALMYKENPEKYIQSQLSKAKLR